MLAKSLKRKLSDYEENMAGAFDSNPGLPYNLQRQLVLNMCLIKLQSCRMLVEPNLHRSVLIANTVRQIQEDMRQESGQPALSACAAETYTGAQTGVQFLGASAAGLHNPPCGSDGPADPPESPGESALGLFSDNDVSSAISSILKDLDFMEDTSPPPAPAPAGAGEGVGCAPPEDRPPEDRPQGSKSADSVFGSFEIANSTGYLTDLAFDDIFEDIDTSMYDTDLCLLPSSPARSLSAAADDVPKPFHFCNSSSVNSIQICRVDFSDLDHIMEILVGS